MKKIWMFFPLLLVCALGYLLASSIEERIEYYYSDHPRILCGNWNWDVLNGSGIMLNSNGSGFLYNVNNEVRRNIRWKCRGGVMHVFQQNPFSDSIYWTEYDTERDGSIYCSNNGIEAVTPNVNCTLVRPY